MAGINPSVFFEKSMFIFIFLKRIKEYDKKRIV
jgi:hypothetical protein